MIMQLRKSVLFNTLYIVYIPVLKALKTGYYFSTILESMNISYIQYKQYILCI